LREVANASPTHSNFVSTVIQSVLRPAAAAAEPPRDEGVMIKLLLELLAENDARLSDGEAWSYLRASKHRKAFSPYAMQ
jgi:hypothetical protein